MNRQQRRTQERIEQKLKDKVEAFRLSTPLAEETHRQGYEAGWHAACDYCMFADCTEKTAGAARTGACAT